jgi:hypothetical protein
MVKRLKDLVRRTLAGIRQNSVCDQHAAQNAQTIEFIRAKISQFNVGASLNTPLLNYT